MSGLEKATLTKLSNERDGTEIGDPVPVQFNPSSLRLTLSNNTEGGQSNARQQRQFTGNASTELSFDLVFDTADEDDGAGGARSVREKTAAVEQFVLPQGSGSERQSPPRVKFHWGELVIEGVITTVSLDFDHFASDGTPLRAKMSVSISEQDAKYELLQAGPGSSTEGSAPTPGGGGAGPGSKGGGLFGKSALALGGESLADFTARVGLEPGAWRGLAAGLEGTLSLSAGFEIDFDASVDLSVGVGVSVGVQADVGASLEASLGLKAGASLSAGASAGATSSTAGGFALSSAGGVGAAVETVKIAKAQAATQATIRSFGAPEGQAKAAVKSGGTAPAVSGAAAAVIQGGVAATKGARRSSVGAPAGEAPTLPSTSPTSPYAGTPAFAPPRADPRATTYGFGVPLRTRVTGAAQSRQGIIALQPYGPARQVPATRDPTVAPWTQLPPASPAPNGSGGAAHGADSSSSGGPGAPVYTPAGAKAKSSGTGSGGGTPCGCGPKGGSR
ncbi:MAG: hypothetical protein GEU90_09130 [Gemmatimonas sp.]|nr:hypothetical protein [Gemmatimonas sp.]